MEKSVMKKLIIITGPSGVGKTPLWNAMQKHHPRITKGLHKLTLYTSRKPRPDEREGVDYFFRNKAFLQRLKRKTEFCVVQVRNDIHALNVRELLHTLKEKPVLYEGNPYVSLQLITMKDLRKIKKLSIFISSLSKKEIQQLKRLNIDVPVHEIITDIMQTKLLRRAHQHKASLNTHDLKNIEQRAKAAFKELQMAYRCTVVVPNHDGEDSPHWQDEPYPTGDAQKTLDTVMSLMAGSKPSRAEHWTKNTL
ncbi:MAG: hypothetical protein GF384_07785 [Elusimicrobia bacterium]|nr:hypothetical protein [Elusimicrobiota bacterium]MBD3412544.1 hypothetical protein [Elusimicrobiota bacterium]